MNVLSLVRKPLTLGEYVKSMTGTLLLAA